MLFIYFIFNTNRRREQININKIINQFLEGLTEISNALITSKGELWNAT